MRQIYLIIFRDKKVKNESRSHDYHYKQEKDESEYKSQRKWMPEINYKTTRFVVEIWFAVKIIGTR